MRCLGLSGDVDRTAGSYGNVRTEKEYRDLISWGLKGNDRYTVDDIIEGIKSGVMQLFEEPEGVLVSQIVQFRTKRLVVFLQAGQNLRTWKDRALEKLKAFKQEQGCEVLEFYCKPGLARILKDDAQIEYVFMRVR